MFIKNDIGNPDTSNIIVERMGYTILMHVRENYANGSVKREARISMDKHLILELLRFLSENIPDGKTYAEAMAEIDARRTVGTKENE